MLRSGVSPAPGARGWNLISVIGRGSYGSVFLASPGRATAAAVRSRAGSSSSSEDGAGDSDSEGDDALVAVKVSYDVGSSPSAVREAALMLQLRGLPHVAHAEQAFFDAGTRPTRMCLVMPLLRGDNAWFAARRRPPEGDAVRAFLRACLTGLAALHARGVVHRDLKPPNIMLARDGDWGSATLTDFGSAQLSLGCVAPIANRAGGHYCTPEFQAPENARNPRAPYLPSGDIWSLATSTCCVVDGARIPRWSSSAPRPDPRAVRPKDLEHLLPLVGAEGVDLLGSMLAPRHADRPTASGALAHAYFR